MEALFSISDDWLPVTKEDGLLGFLVSTQSKTS
jgi:hypothetical protein